MSNNPTQTNLAVVINSEKILEYIRSRELTPKQHDDLEKIRTKLDKGIRLSGTYIPEPNTQDKAMFMANMLIEALNSDDDTSAALACSYLATNYPDLKQIRATVHDDRCSIQLINDQEYQEEHKIDFISKKDLS